jgi:3-phenylpropionate/trans-cinnamate dioxygenase ferredoxin subunit
MSERIKVAETNQLQPGHVMLVRVKGHQLALCNIEGEFYATSNRCTHSGGPLAEGRLNGTTITCPWHGAQFNVTTGKNCGGPAVTQVATYPVHVEGQSIFIEI